MIYAGMQGMIVHVCCRFLRGSCGLKCFTGRELPWMEQVAFCEEAVDWNLYPKTDRLEGEGRFLRGSCGLKLSFRKRCGRLHSRFLRGSCGLKFASANPVVRAIGRFLRGSCGLKSTWGYEPSTPGTVAFCEEAVDWNCLLRVTHAPHATSLSARKLWIEIQDGWQLWEPGRSLSTRKLWIEIRS